MTPLEREYRKIRNHIIRDRYADTGQEFVHQTPAKYALAIARAEVALRQAEDGGLIRFRWEYDQDYEPESAYLPHETHKDYDFVEHERKMLESGSWEALYCQAEIPSRCATCEAIQEDDWEFAAQLGGIVVDVDDKHDYKREVERELASEAGVIE